MKSLSKAESVRALIHREGSVSVIKSMGATEVVVGDMRNTATIHAALQNVRAVYHICPNMSPDEEVIGKLVIREAKQTGVNHFVYHSVLHPQTEKMAHHWQKLHVEEMIFESGLPFTILQPAPYMQNLLAGWKSIIEEGILRVPYSVHARFSFIDLEDVAQAAKIILTEPNHKNAIYELVGTTPISHMEAAEIFSRYLKHAVHAESETIDNWRAQVTGMSGFALENLIKMFEYYDKWGLSGNPNVLKWLLSREPTTVELFLDRIVKENHATN